MSDSLYQQICDRDLLFTSWQAVRDKGSAGGIDGVSLEAFAFDFEAQLLTIENELVAGKFIPQPYQQAKMPKSDGDFRTLGLMCVRDKVVQQAAKTVLEPILDRLFLDVSYAYRKGKGAGKATARVQHLIVNEKREWLTRCDVDAYFDNINHDRLLAMLKKRIDDEPFLALVRVWLKMGRVDKALHWTDSNSGIPQGGIISPLLSNFYLNSLDYFCVDKKWGYVRYADDFVILSRSRDDAENVLKEITAFLLNKLNLRLNADCGVSSVADGFKFLGIIFKGSERGISDEKLASIQDKIRRAVKKDGLQTGEIVCETLQGIANYYGRLLPQSFLEPLDQVLADALKDQARCSMEQGVVTSKQELAKALDGIEFLSMAWQVRKTREMKEILAFAKKREKSEKAPAAANTDKSAVKPKRDPVRKRKREYEKLEAAGFELTVSRSGSFVGKTQKGVVVKVKGQLVCQEPLNNLRHIFITAQGVTISSNLIAWAVQRRIPIDFIEHVGMPYARLSSFHATNYELQRAQILAEDTGKASHLATTFVHGKIRNQMNLVKYYHKYRKSFDVGFVATFDDKIKSMKSNVEEIKKLGKLDHKTLRGILFSIEGRAAAAYWDIIKTLLDDVIVFEGRIGHGASDLVNSLLNYGYSIIYAKIWYTLQRIGLNPYISFLHVPQDGKPTLIFDLIEEFRPQAVDRVVFSQINRGTEFKMDGQSLSLDSRNTIIREVLERFNTAENFRGRSMRLGDIMHEQARNMASFLLGETDRYMPYLGKW